MPDRRLPDPNGRPQPIDAGFGLIELIGFVAAICVGLLMLVGIVTPTMGGTRSTRLKWQERQRQTEEAIRAIAAAEQANPSPADGRR